MPLEVIENITQVEAENRERKTAAEAKAKQIIADAQRDGLALLQQTRAAAADRIAPFALIGLSGDGSAFLICAIFVCG